MARKIIVLLLLTFFFSLPLYAAEGSTGLKTQQDKLSYVVGSQIGASIKSQGIEPNFDVLIQAIKDVYNNQPSRLSKKEEKQVVEKFREEQNKKKEVAELGKNAWKVQLKKPKMMTFNNSKDYYWILKTNMGTIKLKLMPDVAPMHVTSTIYLTRKGFYDGLTFHRIIPGFMAQGGDPLGNGTGGPGYEYKGEFSPFVTFDKPYCLAMANAGAGTDGSQFFITFAPATYLNGKHTIFGHVVAGKDVVKKIEGVGSTSGKPLKTVTIEKATIEVVPR